MLLTGAPLARSIRTRAPLFVNGRSQQKRVISGRLTMPMTRYNRIRRMRRSSHASPGATGARLAQPTPWSVHPAVGARRLRWHEDLPANRPDQDIWFERWPEPSSPSLELPQRTATGACSILVCCSTRLITLLVLQLHCGLFAPPAWPVAPARKASLSGIRARVTATKAVTPNLADHHPPAISHSERRDVVNQGAAAVTPPPHVPRPMTPNSTHLMHAGTYPRGWRDRRAGGIAFRGCDDECAQAHRRFGV
jgi:hypothetical protein